MKIALSDAEKRLSNYLAKGRNQSNRNSGVVDQKMGPQSAHETDLNGIASEIAFCKAANLYPDLELGTYGIGDAYLHDGRSVDVKCTKYKNGHLLAVLGKKDKAPDLYVLAIGEFPVYDFVGYLPSGELLQEKMIKNFGHGEGYAASQGQLYNIKDIL